MGREFGWMNRERSVGAELCGGQMSVCVVGVRCNWVVKGPSESATVASRKYRVTGLCG